MLYGKTVSGKTVLLKEGNIDEGNEVMQNNLVYLCPVKVAVHV